MLREAVLISPKVFIVACESLVLSIDMTEFYRSWISFLDGAKGVTGVFIFILLFFGLDGAFFKLGLLIGTEFRWLYKIAETSPSFGAPSSISPKPTCTVFLFFVNI